MKIFKKILPLLIAALLIPLASLAESLLSYAVPASSTLVQGDKLRVDFMVKKTGRVIFTVLDEDGKKAARYTVNRDKDVAAHYNWAGTSGDKVLPAGKYTLVIKHERDSDEDALKFPLTVVKKGDVPEVSLESDLLFLPASMSDEDVWAAMMSPVYVADVAERSHKAIYTEPNAKSKVVGKIHGQSQAVYPIAPPEKGFVKVAFYRHEDGAYTEGYIQTSVLISFVPNDEYGILLDKPSQTMTIYHQGKKMTTLPITTGLMVAGDYERETRAGAFLITGRQKAYSSHGFKYEYPLGMDGGNLIHSIGYKVINGEKDYSAETALLGTKQSHGCVRMITEPNEDGVNAKWLYENIPYHTKVLVIDDPDQRRERLYQLGDLNDRNGAAMGEEFSAKEWISARESGFVPEKTNSAALPQPVVTKRATAPGDEGENPSTEEEYFAGKDPSALTTVKVTVGGDCVLGSREKERKLDNSFDSVVAENGYAYPFSELADIFTNDDITFVNLECVLKDDKAGYDNTRLYNFRGPTSFTNILTESSIELVNIANNHIIDYGSAGKKSTRTALENAGIPYSGYSYTYIYEVNGVKIGFGGVRETTYRQNPQIPERDIKAMREQGAQVVIYAAHFGDEYSRTHNELQTKIAHAIIDAGADIVVGAHPHVVQGIEIYKGKPIFYSVGNLMFGGTLEMTEFDAVLLQMELDFDGEKYVGVRTELTPVFTTGSMPDNDFRPVIQSGADSQRTLGKIQTDTTFTLPDKIYCPAE